MTTLCHFDDIPEGKAKCLEYAGKQMFAVKWLNKIYLYLNQCPHLGVNLNWQGDDFFNFDETLLQCSTHGALFEIESGLCIAGPCKRQSLYPIPFKLDKELVVLTDLSIFS